MLSPARFLKHYLGSGRMKAYINYPNNNLTLHTAANCASIQQQSKPGQRSHMVTVENLSQVLSNFRDKGYRFASQADTNDMWLTFQLNDPTFERALFAYIKTLL